MKYFLSVVFVAHLWALSTSLTAAPAAFQPLQPLPAQPPIPPDNPQTPAKIALGKQLFFDPRLSVNGSLSCNSCHNVLAGGEDGRRQTPGAHGKPNPRSVPTLWNVAYFTAHYRDGRVDTLEQQVQDHLLSETEMGNANPAQILDKLRRIPGYVSQFTQVFGKEGLTYHTLAQAISAYERTLVTPNSRYDRYLRGKKQALSPQERRGLRAFVDTGCAACHFYVNLAGPVPGLAFQQGEGFYELFPNYVGSEYDSKYRLLDDPGRYRATGDETEKRFWRVPSLRNIAVTAPYFHNGAVNTLDEAVRVMAKTQLNKVLTEQQVQDIVAFLNSTTGEFPRTIMPRLPPSPNTTVLESSSSAP